MGLEWSYIELGCSIDKMGIENLKSCKLGSRIRFILIWCSNVNS